MPAQLLATKLFIPATRGEHVSRGRLVSYLNVCFSHQLTLLSAPAGYGKTSLLSEWCSTCQFPVAWLSLDEGDNDPARFQEYLLAAFKKAGIISDSELPSTADLSDAVAMLINALTEVSTSVVLVLDDYHLLTTKQVHDALTFLLDHQPVNLHIMIASRADPHLPLARLRGRGQLAELRLADLRFSEEETFQFLVEKQRLELTNEDLSTLIERTERWPAGLQMAAAALNAIRRTNRPEQTHQFIQAFSGSNRFILDYLMEEVLNHTSEDVRSFLYQTAFFGRFTAELCAKVIQPQILIPEQRDKPHRSYTPEQCQNFLDLIEQDNLFILPLDPERRWYRYHPLFADLLRKRMEEITSEAIPELHRRAGHWFKQQGMMEPAIDHALQAEDYTHAASLLETIVEALLNRGELTNFSRWCRALPEHILHSHPLLTVYYGYTLLLRGESQETVEIHLQQAESQQLDRSASAAIMTLRSFFLALQGDIQTSIELANKALIDLPAEHEFLRNYARVMLAFPYLWSGKSAEAIQIFEEAINAGKSASNLLFTPMVMRRLARLYASLGQLQKAYQYLDYAVRLATDAHGNLLPHAGMLLVTRGDIKRELNDLVGAENDLRQGLEMLQQWGKVRAADGYTFLANVFHARGEWESAQTAIHKAVEMAQQTEEYEFDDVRTACMQARLNLRQGNIDAAKEWARTAGLEDDPGPSTRLVGNEPLPNRLLNYLRREEYLVLARLRIAEGKPDQALKVLNELLAIFKKESWTINILQVEILRALAYDSREEGPESFRSLKTALELGQPGGFVRVFLDEGGQMQSLLHRFLIEEGDVMDRLIPYIHHLLEEYAAEGKPVLKQTSQQQELKTARLGIDQGLAQSIYLTESLSERELDVLKLLSTYLTTPEIAERLGVSVSTIRTHVKNIYGKLNVHARIDAVEKGKKLNLI